jgi:hypothetical protein
MTTENNETPKGRNKRIRGLYNSKKYNKKREPKITRPFEEWYE